MKCLYLGKQAFKSRLDFRNELPDKTLKKIISSIKS